jgi:N-acetylglucosamine-6-phosphate deacetylase
VHTESELQPASIELFERFQQAARGHIRLITIAPEIPGAIDLISYCSTHGVRLSLGHTNATTAEAQAGIAAGARSATHTFNAMRPFDHRETGIVGETLTRDDLYAELICDGIHVAPAAVQLFSRAKGLDRAILVTDSISATGMGDGTYKLGDLEVTVAGSRCLLAGTETLAGSVLTIEQAVLNYSRFTGLPWQKVARLASTNPAQMLGLSSEIGNLAPGSAANFNRYDASGKRIATYLRG